MKKTKVIILSGYGLNCEEETKFAFDLVGASADIVHINDLIADKKKLELYQILVFPGGFSYGDDTGSGKAFANKLKNHLWGELQEFVKGDRLVLGICNGFQILTNLGLLPGALTFNQSARYLDRWVDIKIENKSPWLKDIENLTLPIAHGEGKFYAEKSTLKKLNQEGQIAARYYKGEICKYQNLPENPNGTLENIAAVTSNDGRVLGMMPHPERAIFSHQLPHWPFLKEKYRRNGLAMPAVGPGLKIFENAVKYFESETPKEPVNNWYVITGGPSAGKTTVLKALEKLGYTVVHEAARTYVDAEIALGKSIGEIRGNEKQFQQKILELKIESEKKLEKNKIVFLDRGIPDSIAYYQLAGLPADDPFLKKALDISNYQKVFLLDLLPMEKDYIRTDADKAELIHQSLEECYLKENFEVIKVPRMSVKKRVNFILKNIKKDLGSISP